MDLLNRFLKNETFLDLPSPTIRFGDRKIERAKVAANPTVSSSSSSTNAEIGSNNSFVVGGGGVALLAFVGGIIFTLLFTKFQNSKRKGGKYSRIPETR